MTVRVVTRDSYDFFGVESQLECATPSVSIHTAVGIYKLGTHCKELFESTGSCVQGQGLSNGIMYAFAKISLATGNLRLNGGCNGGQRRTCSQSRSKLSRSV